MNNSKNKYLLRVFEQKTINYPYLLLCHSLYLSISEINLLKQHVKNSGINNLKLKNKIACDYFKKFKNAKINLIFNGQNLVFLSTKSEFLLNFYNKLIFENTRIIPLIYIHKQDIFVLDKDLNLIIFDINNYHQIFINILLLLNLYFINKLNEINILMYRNANFNTIN